MIKIKAKLEMPDEIEVEVNEELFDKVCEDNGTREGIENLILCGISKKFDLYARDIEIRY